jgi:hypothetical protein
MLKYFLIFIFSIILSSCNALKPDIDPVTGKKVRKEPNLSKRAKDYADEGGGIFNSSRINGGTTYDFATSNIMWRATIVSLDFIPLQSANYSGGLLITDWYSNNLNSNESIKLEVRFLSNEISPNSIKITSYKKICKNLNCKTEKLNDNFNQKLKDTIMEKVRILKLEEDSKKTKKRKS